MYNNYLKKMPDKYGVYTTVMITEDSPICEFLGKVYTSEELKTASFKEQDALQIAPNKYLAPSGNIDDYIAHSCRPNCILHTCGARAILYSIHAIPKGAEITFDYSSSSDDSLDSWKMICKCGAPNCRGVISGFQNLDPALQEEYKKKGIAAFYIRHNIFSKF